MGFYYYFLIINHKLFKTRISDILNLALSFENAK